MKITKIVFLICALLGVKGLWAQESTDSTDTKIDSSNVPLTYNVGVGLYNYRGDVGFIKELGTTENLQPAFSAGVEYKLHSSFGLGLNAAYGNLVKNEKNGGSNRNFKTQMISGGLEATFHFANGFILAEDYPVDPFISIGFDAISFNPKTDILDADGNVYFYWQDGSVRDVSQGSGSTGNFLTRDYDYETEIPAEGESKLAFGYPVSAGFNFFITPYLKTRIKQTVSLTNTDFLDGHLGGQANDIYMYSSVSFVFNPAGLKPSAKNSKSKEYKDIDFVSLLKADSDADGVLDIDDHCNDTPEGYEVDRHGCPQDKDEDGIPDHLDQEINTDEEVAQIDSNGVAIPDSLVTKAFLDSVVTLREELCQFYPSMCQGDESDIEFGILNNGEADKRFISAQVEPSKRPIEEIIKICDSNGNGKVSSKEIYEGIDNYFDGKIDLKLGDIHKLIDYYFEQ